VRFTAGRNPQAEETIGKRWPPDRRNEGAHTVMTDHTPTPQRTKTLIK